MKARRDRREEIFRDDQDREKFLGYLAEGSERYRGKVHCYVLINNHFHLIATTTEVNPFEVGASTDDCIHGLLQSPAPGSRASVSGQIQEDGH